MSDLVLWNSMAVRRRSASDTFQENGLAIIRQYLGERGFRVHMEDWAHSRGYRSLAPSFLLRLNRRTAKALLSAGDSPFRKKALGVASLMLQKTVLSCQNRRMKRRIRNLARMTGKEGIPLAGVKVWYGEAFLWSDYFCRMVRKYSPDTLLVAGGYHVSLYKEDFLRYSSFDLAVDGPGEKALAELCVLTGRGRSRKEILTLLKLGEKKIGGLLYRDGRSIRTTPQEPADLSEKEYPRYPEKNGKVGVHILMDSLGCPWNRCSFCVHNQFSPEYHPRDISDIIGEIRHMRAQGIGLFRFAGSDTPPPFGARIARAILDEKLTVEYSIGCRGVREGKDEADFEILTGQFALMIQSGLRGVFIGGETGHDGINREMMNKGLTAKDLVHTVRAIREAEKRPGTAISVSLAFIYPVPLVDGVGDEDVIRENLRLMEACRPDAVMITPPGPFKNSQWYLNRDKFGFELGEDFIREMMGYEYVLYKPLSLWPPLTMSLQGRSFKEILAESQRFKGEAESKLGMFTDLSDEHFLMIRAMGQFNREGIEEFTRETLLDIISADYRYLDRMGEKVTAYSAELAGR